MKVLVTGAFGNLGTRVIDLMLQRNIQVTALDLETPKNVSLSKPYKKKIAIDWGDIRDGERIEKLVRSHDAVIHLAAIISPFAEKNPTLAEAVNIGGTMNVLRAIENSPQSPLLVFASSFAVFGFRQHLQPPRTLADHPIATDDYSRQKILCEEIIQASSCNWTILRLGAMVDSRMRHSDKEQIRLSLQLAPDNRVEYVHPTDAALAIVNALEQQQAIHRVLLIGGGSSCQVTHIELMNAMSGAMGLTFKAEDFGSKPLYADWVESDDAQRILSFQNHTFGDFRQENYDRFKYLRVFVSPFSEIIKFGLKIYLAIQ